MTKLTWAELSQQQKNEFTKQLIHCGDKDPENYPNHTYQIKDGKCHGWIYKGEVYKKYSPKFKVK
jgi:hypothetical protein